MTPRLKSSKKWTGFPGDFQDQIKESLIEYFGKELRGAELIIEGRIYPQEILVRLGFIRKGELTQHNFEVSVFYKEDTAISQIHFGVDAAASLMNEFLIAESTSATEDEGAEFDLPRTWKEIEFEGQTLSCQYTTVNSRLEAAADELLGVHEDSLVHGEDEDSDEEDEIELSDESLNDDSEDTRDSTALKRKNKKPQIH